MDERYETFQSDASGWCVIDTWNGDRYVEVAPDTTFVNSEDEAEQYAHELNNYQTGQSDR